MLWHGTGCLVSAEHLAGFSNPKLKVKKSALGFSAEADTDFAGKLKADYNPETKQFSIDAEINSDAGTVIAAQGERADHLIELRKIEATYLLEAQKAVGENFKAFGQMLAIAAAGGGDGLKKVIDAAAPILAGSAGALELPSLGHLRGQLGTGAAPQTEGPEEPEKIPGNEGERGP